MIVELFVPSRNSRTCLTMDAASRPARLGTPPRLLPSVPWQLAQFAAMSRPRLGSAPCAEPMPIAATAANSSIRDLMITFYRVELKRGAHKKREPLGLPLSTFGDES